MALSHGNLTATMSRPATPCRRVALLQCIAGRRDLVSFLLLSTAAMVPQAGASDSKTALLQEYLKRSKDNKEKNDKERLDDYYRRNYKDYFEFVEGSTQGEERELTESEKGIREWLNKNRK